MRDLTCAEVHDAAAEYAFDIIEPSERAAVAAHLIRCPDCRQEVDSMEESAHRLLDLIPGTEPPLGFDERVLHRLGTPVRPARRRFRTIATLAAAVLLVVGSTFGVELTRSGTNAQPALASAQLWSGGTAVGEVYMYGGRPPWFEMTVQGIKVQGKLSCAVVTDAGATTIGSFELHHGRAYWTAPDKSGAPGVTGVQLLDDTGHVVASASFS
jgi:Putative zinc-finger